ncbi:MAG TPA: chemotaxis protein CheW [Spirochaetota bacterium]|nr:chemotaxis protein CheW [Spirochaetota bacterium]HPS85575.1 chemotaxis protein CheW [Spirochaetota bacterium]
MPAISQQNKQTVKTENISGRQYVTFSIKDELYGIDVRRAREVMNLPKITKVPDTMPFMKGVIDLRGKIIPLIDMRIKFKIDEKTYDQNTVIIIIDVKKVVCGIIVDSVSDVVNMPLNDVQHTPHFASEVEKDSVFGIGKIGDKLVIVLDVDRLLSDEELLLIKAE